MYSAYDIYKLTNSQDMLDTISVKKAASTSGICPSWPQTSFLPLQPRGKSHVSAPATFRPKAKSLAATPPKEDLVGADSGREHRDSGAKVWGGDPSFSGSFAETPSEWVHWAGRPPEHREPNTGEQDLWQLT